MLLTAFKVIKVQIPSQDVPVCVMHHVLAGTCAPLSSYLLVI